MGERERERESGRERGRVCVVCEGPLIPYLLMEQANRNLVNRDPLCYLHKRDSMPFIRFELLRIQLIFFQSSHLLTEEGKFIAVN